MKFDWQNWNLGGKIIFVAACLAAATMLMKWVDVGIISQSGLSQQAYIFLAFWGLSGPHAFQEQGNSPSLGTGVLNRISRHHIGIHFIKIW